MKIDFSIGKAYLDYIFPKIRLKSDPTASHHCVRVRLIDTKFHFSENL